MIPGLVEIYRYVFRTPALYNLPTLVLIEVLYCLDFDLDAHKLGLDAYDGMQFSCRMRQGTQVRYAR